jgi:predicted Zn-dependent protease
VTLSYGVLNGDSDPIQAVKDARRPKNILDELSEMNVAYSEGKWAAAIKAARIVLQRDTRHEEALRTVASCELKLQRPANAVVAMKAILKEVPEDVTVRSFLAQTLWQLGKKDESRKQWAEVEASPYASHNQRNLARKTLRVIDDPLGGMLPTPPSMSVAPTKKNRLQ